MKNNVVAVFGLKRKKTARCLKKNKQRAASAGVHPADYE
jgi:hypothetical protein